MPGGPPKILVEEDDIDSKRKCSAFKDNSRDKVVFGVFLMNLWYPGQNLDESFRSAEMEDGLKGLTLESREKLCFGMEKDIMKRSLCFEFSMKTIEFPFFFHNRV
ncbi:hypothetical protein E2542_SST28604 [Spatholobus suberectus]|nr:hypothetical protein E2542_SST28604 [Spatholobus suberectus]